MSSIYDELMDERKNIEYIGEPIFKMSKKTANEIIENTRGEK